ncbi:hypothetical protein JCM10908_005991 [Rhodotorula pacifica]|uniref:uncharacterized protein n=1 Tax=Rhodotorula pacifica TaxID=1495444 RepID=UPI00316FC190
MTGQPAIPEQTEPDIVAYEIRFGDADDSDDGERAAPDLAKEIHGEVPTPTKRLSSRPSLQKLSSAGRHAAPPIPRSQHLQQGKEPPSQRQDAQSALPPPLSSSTPLPFPSPPSAGPSRRRDSHNSRRPSVVSTSNRSTVGMHSSDLYSPAKNIFPLVSKSNAAGKQRERQGSATGSVLSIASTPPASAAASPIPSPRGHETPSQRRGSSYGLEDLSIGTPRSETSDGLSRSASLFSMPFGPAAVPRHRQASLSSSSSASLAPPSLTSSSASPPPKRAVITKPTYTSSLAPTHAEKFYAASGEQPTQGGSSGSIFQNPTPTSRSIGELVPRKKLSSFFSSGGNNGKRKGETAASASYGGSASVLDAALAASTTWAHRRGQVGGGGGGGAGTPAPSARNSVAFPAYSSPSPTSSAAFDPASRRQSTSTSAFFTRRESMSSSVDGVDPLTSASSETSLSVFPTRTRPVFPVKTAKDIPEHST